MEHYLRYAVYFAPAPGPLADFGAAWLGWDAQAGCAVAHPQVPGLPCPVAEVTRQPRKYGFHGTLKPPFRLAGGCAPEDLAEAVELLAARLAPVRMPGLQLDRIGRFLALTPKGDGAELAALAGAVVTGLDAYRAPLTAEEFARRRPDRLDPRQRANLEQWGYPYVLEEFRFHLTLTGPMEENRAQAVRAALAPVLEPLLPVPFEVPDICLFGEGEDGYFRLVHRYALSG
ncbi:MAG: DUF1045 domain-containing protein [Sediminimonas qiaohouensis]|uniref:DUF1045 domain-containing protein n=1 Tax=Sediminimonas qiaohouensis TaxID=552061 RepID=A0A7C9HBH4_9RHOB|nr:DUF1045 domain-containing protein [Sediminimonas qiaohouensis]MTJ05144.1 DUF1045 domain-containing protein [Sediminimonas qiaohouensis]